MRSRIGALEADTTEMAQVRAASTAPAIQLTALDYLLATTRAMLDWLRQFADSLESDTVGWRDAEGTARTETSGVAV